MMDKAQADKAQAQVVRMSVLSMIMPFVFYLGESQEFQYVE